MRLYSVLVPALVGNVAVWWIYFSQDDLGFPWPAFVTLVSIASLIRTAQRGGGAPIGREGNRNRNRNRSRAR
jgi:hypothetical protein